ncbi:hypothetical protein, unknown function [Leishmania tarentolae]|uniref:RING-type domain-containing protein n=1 Tax=Leishmania tarentolae TaxID=5689 RepID=A0A640KAN2_LEITA|nr:hypothetical protein, unknown function [Leishmania tarentolae]
MPCPAVHPVLVLVIGVGSILLLYRKEVWEWLTHGSKSEQTKETETGYYRMPPRADCAAACAKAIEEDLLEQSLVLGGGARQKDLQSSGCGSRYGMCVCCLELRQRFMFVLCRHMCLCEPCLIQAARTYEETVLFAPFDGPVKMPCLVCRKMSYVVKVFSS